MSEQRSIEVAGKHVGPIGFGGIQLSIGEPPQAEEISIEALKTAADNGATLWNTATYYRGYHNLSVFGAFFKKYPEYIDRIVMVVKGGFKNRVPVFDIGHWRSDLLEAQKALGEKKIDVYSLARIAPGSAIEDNCRALLQLRDEGLFRAIGCSELKRSTLEQVQQFFNPACLEIEVSLWSFDTDVQDCIAWSTQYSVPILAYSPLGRGFLTAKYTRIEDIPAGSHLHMFPRFREGAFEQNVKLVRALQDIAARKHIPTGQLALAWVVSLNRYMIPIPGSSKAQRVKENCEAARVDLTEADQAEIQQLLENFTVAGNRYPDALSGELMQ